MAKNDQKQGKSETLTIRLDAKSRFILEYLSRMNGQTITTVVERAIMRAADGQRVYGSHHDGDKGWQDFWDVSDGVRALRIAERSEFFPSFEEERRLKFAKVHWQFFWIDERRSAFSNFYIDVLWPRIDEFVAIHESSKVNGTDFFAAGMAMVAALKAARLQPPEWPPKNTKPSAPVAMERPAFDDDIPF